MYCVFAQALTHNVHCSVSSANAAQPQDIFPLAVAFGLCSRMFGNWRIAALASFLRQIIVPSSFALSVLWGPIRDRAGRRGACQHIYGHICACLCVIIVEGYVCYIGSKRYALRLCALFLVCGHWLMDLDVQALWSFYLACGTDKHGRNYTLFTPPLLRLP